MGGIGSGRGFRLTRFDRKWTCEESKRIDIRSFSKRYMLKPGRYFPVSWTSARSESVDSIGIKIGEEEIILIYTITDHETEKKTDFRYSVELDYTPCNYGGRRIWLRCPVCYRRVALIYMDERDGYFKCRICANLNYQSSQDNNERCYSIDSKIRRIGRRLKIPESDIYDTEELLYQAFTKKPKGMHNKTYNRLIGRLEELSQERSEAFIRGMARATKGKYIALNKIGGEWDLPKLKDLLLELDTRELDMDITDFDSELEELMTQFYEPDENEKENV